MSEYTFEAVELSEHFLRNDLETTESAKIEGSNVKQRTYKLNDVGALKKKGRHENREVEIEIGNEALLSP